MRPLFLTGSAMLLFSDEMRHIILTKRKQRVCISKVMGESKEMLSVPCLALQELIQGARLIKQVLNTAEKK